MKEEIKVNKANKSITFINNGIGFSQFGVADEILDLITNLQEDLKHQEEMEEEYNKKHTKLMQDYSKLQEENERLKQDNYSLIDYQDMEIRYNDYKSRIDKAIELTENLLKTEDKGYYQILFKKQLEVLQGEDTKEREVK